MKTKQETFDEVAVKLVEQGDRSSDGAFCMYRDPEGRRCAAGHLIPDAAYKPSFEKCALGLNEDLDAVVRATGHDFEFVHVLQKLHDHTTGERWLSHWSAKMSELAAAENLSTAALDNALAARTAAQVTP